MGKRKVAVGQGNAAKKSRPDKSPKETSLRGALVFQLSQEAAPTVSGAQLQQQFFTFDEAPTANAIQTLWCDKHFPKRENDLAVNKKKIGEIKSWLEACKEKGPLHHCLILTGPSGCGKSSCIKVLAEQAGFEVCTWVPPVPTSWSEYKYQGTSAPGYVSKVADFEEYAARSKMSLLPLTVHHEAAASQQHTTRTKLLVVDDDLPYAVDATQRERITTAVGDLVRCSRCPVVVILSEEGGSDKAGKGGRGSGNGQAGRSNMLKREVVEMLEDVGAAHVSLNPIPPSTLSKLLLEVCAQEGGQMSKDDALVLAQQAGGDMRSALSTLQFVLTGRTTLNRSAAAVKGRGASRRGYKSHTAVPSQLQGKKITAGKDPCLSMFHVLGKILYNKRKGEEDATTGGSAMGPPPQRMTLESHDVIDLTEDDTAAAVLGRAPPQDDVESVIDQSSLGPDAVLSFLHHHYPAFVAADYIQEGAQAAAYFSDADVLCNYWGSLDYTADLDSFRTTSLTAAVAGSVAAHGWMYSNAHPAPRRWYALDAPLMGVVQRSASANEQQIQSVMGSASRSAITGLYMTVSSFASQLLPIIREMQHLQPHSTSSATLLPRKWYKVWEKAMVPVYESSRGQHTIGPGLTSISEEADEGGGPTGATIDDEVMEDAVEDDSD